MSLRVEIDRDRCVGGGRCVDTAPAVFDQDEDGLVVLLNPSPPEEARADVELAVELCPGRVITVTDQDATAP